jgi:hypothetical protein
MRYQSCGWRFYLNRMKWCNNKADVKWMRNNWIALLEIVRIQSLDDAESKLFTMILDLSSQQAISQWSIWMNGFVMRRPFTFYRLTWWYTDAKFSLVSKNANTAWTWNNQIYLKLLNIRMDSFLSWVKESNYKYIK